MQTVTSNTLLAKLLATENITVQHQSGIKTAMFDLKNRVLMLPVWQDISDDLKHLLIGHETGHAIDTPSAEEYREAYEGIAKRIFGDDVANRLIRTCAGFLNVVEDARIDKRQKRRYPGLRKNYLLGYKELLDRDFFGTKGRDLNSMNFIDRLNIYFKGGNVNCNIEFSPEEKAFIKRVENLEKFDETVSLTEEIYLFCKGKIENEETDIGLGESEEGEGNDEFDYDTDSDYGDDFDSDNGSHSEDEEGAGEGEDEADEDSNSLDGDADKNADGDHEGSIPESLTDRVWQEKQEELVKNADTDYIYVNLPTIDYSKVVHPFKKVLEDWRRDLANQSKGNFAWRQAITNTSYEIARTEMMEWRRQEKDAISFLVKEFEQRKSAEIYSRISVAKTGVIDTNKLHSYRYNDDIFRRLSVVPEGKNHGFVMFLDWSGSMAYNLKNTIKQLFTLALFCKQIQVPFEVYAFKDSDHSTPWVHEKENSLNFGNLTLRQFLSSRMNIAELNEAMTFLWAAGNGYYPASDGLGGTPLNEALIVAPKIVNDFRAKYKLEIVNTIVLTDGESNGCSNSLTNQNNSQYTHGRRQQYLLNDKDTGKTYEICMNNYYTYGATKSNTTTYLNILKEKTNCNLIGFFLFGESWRNFTYRFNLRDNYDYLQKVTKFWKDNKFFPIKSEGYDEYFVIDSNALKNDDNELEIDTTKSTKQMAKAFSKFAAKKSVNRVLLRNFIDHVTNKAKKAA